MTDENKQFGDLVGGLVVCLFFLPTPGLIIGGIAWRYHVCDAECNCAPDKCCVANGSCPVEQRCSCLSDANDWSEPSCEEKKEDCDQMYPFALAMMLSGFTFIGPLCILLLLYFGYWAIKTLYERCLNAIRRCMKPKASEVELGNVENTIQ